MYIPSSFRVTDQKMLTEFMQRQSFATLVSSEQDGPIATHLPMLYRADVGSYGGLVSHMARADPQWKCFESSQELLAIFHGPHSYISPSWYEEQVTVPTWNYAAVHAYGVAKIIDDHDRMVRLLDETVKLDESGFDQPWPGEIPDDYRDMLIKGIVAFEIPISRVEGKFKLSQNHSDADRQGVFDALSKSSDTEKQSLAGMMQRAGLTNDSEENA